MATAFKGPGRRALVAGIAIAVLALLSLFFLRQRAEVPELGAAVSEGGTPASAPQASAPAETSEPTAAPEADESAPAEAAQDAQTPEIDVVRIAPDGWAVVAGRAEPGARVTVNAEDEELAETQADTSGEFVAIFDAERSTMPRTLTFGAETPEGETQRSEDTVLLLPEPRTAAEEGEAESVEESAEDPAPEVAVAAVVRDGTLEVVPMPRPAGSRAPGIQLASISYTEAGNITLAGFGTPDAEVRAYLDNAFVGDGGIDNDGRWTLELQGVNAGLHRVRIDLLGDDGKVASRVETPFQRDYPAAAPDDAVSGTSVIVQPGSNLWTLARIHYGSGVLYTRIYTANHDLIGDPHLIYPGQIFALPESQETGRPVLRSESASP